MKEFFVNGVKLESYPLTAAQRIHNFSRMSCPFHQLLNIGTGLYIQQETDFNILKSAIKESVNRFDSMRLRFLQDENGDVYQYLVPFDDRDIELVDFSDWNEEDATREMEKWTAVPFERFYSPMNLIKMIKLPNGYNGIYSKVDHMTMDSSSIITFYADVLQIYCNKRYGTEYPKPMQSYIKCLEKDLAYEADSPARRRDEKFWRDVTTASEPMYTDFNGMGKLITQRREENNPNLRAASNRKTDTRAAISIFQLEKEPSDRLLKFCEDNHIPVVCLLLMGLRTVLSKFNDHEEDVSVRTCVSRRGTLLEKRSGGTRIHFFPIRTIMSPDMTFMDGLKMYQEKQNEIFRHANYDSVAQMMMSANHWNTPGKTYESLSLTYQPMSMKQPSKDLPDIPYKSMWYTNGVAAQPLYLTVMHRVEDNGLNFNFEYQKAAVTDYEMEYFYYYLCRVLFRGIENSNRTIGEILDMI
ncbi:MAG: condensation domain-containing protein [Ruminococcus flavefaciens]|nr:condensation domain-containing protein [Ruminococcus flavefaciens]MCM1230975.1 condensation domain-containing protein [Ruminococcus flavefaciens]